MKLPSIFSKQEAMMDVNKLSYTEPLKITKRKKVASNGLVSIGSKYAGQHVMVRDNNDGTLTVFLPGEAR